MNKHSKATSSSVKATRQGKDTKKRKILLRATMIVPGVVQISLWDKDFEIGTIMCPVEVYGLHDYFYSILDKMLMDYARSEEYKNMLEKEGRAE